MSTLLGGEVDPEVKARQDADARIKRETYGNACTIVFDVLLAGYRDGSGSFETLCKKARRATEKLSEAQRWRVLGEVADLALAKKPKRKRGRPKTPEALPRLATGMVDLARKRENLPTKPNAKDMATCFERAREIFLGHGLDISAASIQRWYYEIKPPA